MANDLEQKIIRQIEYYFGDINLPRDKFMQEKLKEDEGWINLDVLLTFKRLASLSKDANEITGAIKKSENQLIEVSADGKKLRRSPDVPLPELNEERRKELMNRTAYAKGFPLNETLDSIVTFLEAHGPIDSVNRRTLVDKIENQRKFKGSCFIIFKTVELCKKFIETESLKYKDTELIRKWQKDYLEEKKKEIEDRKKNKAEKQQKAAAKTEETITVPKGALLHFTGIEENQMLTREEIKEKIKELNDSDPYLDFNKGDLQGYIRLQGENSAVELYSKLNEGILKVGEIELKLRVLEGTEEKEYIKKIADIFSRKRDKSKGNKKQHRKRKGKFEDGGPKPKQTNVD